MSERLAMLTARTALLGFQIGGGGEITPQIAAACSGLYVVMTGYMLYAN